ncbi:MAG: hypothetical protein ACM3KL_08650 [Alphaproteobacteria bacterium]
MKSVGSEIAVEPLLFSWDSPRGQTAVLVSFLVLSLVAHALCFYVFQIVYPTPVAVLPPPARVTFIAGDSDEGRTLLRWIDAEDPSLAFTTVPPPGATLRDLPIAEHIPTYSTLEPTLKDLPALKPDLRIPSSRLPGAVRTVSRKSVPTPGSGRTLISFSKDLDRLGTPSLPTPRFVASNKEAPEALRFRVAVDGFGKIRYCFPINSSGDPALDEQAHSQVIHSQFPPNSASAGNTSSSLVWGIATIQWGNDVVRPQQPFPASVTP